MKKTSLIITILLIYLLNTTFAQWTQVGSDIGGEAEWDLSGFSVSLSSDGSRVAVGAYQNDGTGGEAGHVRIYSESGGVWTQVGSDIDGEAVIDRSGFSVSLSSDGSRVAIGAYQNDGTGANAGHVRIYSESGGVWTQVGSDIEGEAEGDNSGISVSLSSDGSRVAIGAYQNDGTGAEAGHVRVYSESGGVWTQVGSDIDGEAADDRSGISVSLSSGGNAVAIGAYWAHGIFALGSGHVRIYSESGGVWTQVGSDIDGEAAGDWSGHSVSLSSDGMKVAVGAYKNDGNGTESGHVRIYSESGGVWTQVGSDIDGEDVGDWSGHSVSLSSDGNRVAIGAPYSDETGTNAGHTRIYINESALALEDSDMFDSLPTTLTVLPAYPNPFNPSTTVTYGLDTNSKVEIQIYDINGRLITTLHNAEQKQGWYSIQWNGTNDNNEQVPAGIYLSKTTSNNEVKTTKLMLLK